MRIMRRLHRTETSRGDTIVEVLIAIAVVSLILAGAYVTTNRSLMATRAAQERGNALKIAEAQIEQVKALTASNPTTIFDPAAPLIFCVSKASGLPVTAADPACIVDLAGDQISPSEDPNFTIRITRTGHDFLLDETWTDASGELKDNLQLRYRVYE